MLLTTWSITVLIKMYVFMKVISKYPIPTSLILMVINLSLAFFLISILMDGIVEYKLGFVINAPIVLLILVAFVLVYVKYFSKKYFHSRRFSITVTLIILGLINMLIYLFNVICWIDLFDGKTNALLP